MLRFLNSGSTVVLIAAFVLLGAMSVIAAESNQKIVYVGTYTNHGSKGIYSYKFDTGSGELTSIGLAAETSQPSWVVISSNGKHVYAANEMQDFQGQKSGAVSAFAATSTSQLAFLNQLPSRGADPAYITLDRTGKYLIAANYSGGNLTIFPIEKDGKIGTASDFVQHKGSGVNKERQEGPHPHEVVMSPDNRFALVPDLGLDEVVIYPFDSSKGKFGTPHVQKVAPGEGPRHAAFSKDGKFFYLMTEMGSKVIVFAYGKGDGTLKELQTISSLPAGFKGDNTGAEAEVHPSGKFLYVSNRGDNNSIAVFGIDGKSGKLKLIQIESTQGKTPRHFAIDPTGKWLLAENQDSDSIVIFRIDPATGHLTNSGHKVEISSPTCIQFAPEH